MENRLERLKHENGVLKEKLALLNKENKFLRRGYEDSVKLLRDFPGAMILVQEGKVILTNDATLNQLGYTEQEILGRSFLDFVHANAFDYVKKLHQRRIAGKSVPDRYETYLVTKSGEPFCCEVRVKKIRHKGRRAFLVNLLDLDQRKQKEIQLRQSQKMEALARMAQGLSRELNDCLPILAEHAQHFEGLESFQNKSPTPYLEKIESARNLWNCINQQLRCLTKSKNERSDVALLDLRKIVKDAVAITSPRWKEEPESRGVKINVKAYLRTISPVEGHPKEILDAFVSLISNAIDALPDGGEIYLTTEESSGLAHAYIQDNGTGISDDIKEKIFDPFFTTRGESRFGMGLSLAQTIITRNKGEIEFISQKGHGTTFIVKLPLAKEAPRPRPRRAKNRIRNSSILIIAEESIVNDLLSQLLISKGGKITTSSTATEGLKLLTKNQFDLIILDVNTSDLEPASVIPEIKEIGVRAPIALIRPEQAEDYTDVFLKVGADVVIDRPLDMPKILSLVSEALAKNGQLEETF